MAIDQIISQIAFYSVGLLSCIIFYNIVKGELTPKKSMCAGCSCKSKRLLNKIRQKKQQEL